MISLEGDFGSVKGKIAGFPGGLIMRARGRVTIHLLV